MFDEETYQKGLYQYTKHEEEEVEHIPFEERMTMALEGRNDGMKMEVSEYAGSLKP